MTKLLLLRLPLLCTFRCSTPFAFPAATTRSVQTYFSALGSGDDAAASQYGSDLRDLLPTPKKRVLALDKHGRRVYDLTDDGATKYTLERGRVAVTVGSPSQQGDEAPAPSLKEQAADASSAGFGGEENFGAGLKDLLDLRDLLPTPKKRALALDKHGRRVYDLTDDGATKYTLERGRAAATAGCPPLEGDQAAAPSGKERAADASSAAFGGEGDFGAGLKDLLPTRKMRFIKLDKFGRRIQKMEDDGTVNTKKEPRPETSANDYGSLKDLVPSSSASLTSRRRAAKGLTVPSETAQSSTTPKPVSNYGSLKGLAPTRALWTKLDFKGGAIEDERRTKNKKLRSNDSANDHRNLTSKGLKELLPKKTIWTKLDFHGRQVEDERRTKNNAESSDHVASDFNEAGSSNLREFLPERTVSFRNVLSGGSVRNASGSARGSRKERRQLMQEEVTASAAAAAMTLSNMENAEDDANAHEDDVSDKVKAYTNLKTLLPPRTITWKKKQVFSSGSAATVNKTSRGLREEKEAEQVTRNEVTALAAAAMLSDMKESEDVSN